MKKAVSRPTGDETARPAEPSLAARVIVEGIESVTEVVHGALDAALDVTRHTAKAAAKTSRVDGRNARWAEHRAARRDELIDAAVSAIGTYGANVGMEQIAAVAKTSKPVIYRYFSDKTDLYRAVGQRVVGQVLVTLSEVLATDPPPRELLHAGVDAYLSLLEENPELYRFASQHPLRDNSDGTTTDFSALVAELLSQQLEKQLSDNGLDPALAHPWGDAIVGFIRSASLWWLDHRDAMTRRQLTDYLSALLWGGAAGVYRSAGKDVDATPAPGVFGTPAW